MQTLSLKTSKKLAELGVEVESEEMWYIVDGKSYLLPYGTCRMNWTEKYPALSLQEIFTALPAIGEKLGWEDSYVAFSATNADTGGTCSQWSGWKGIAHTLTDAYLANKMEGVDQELYTLLVNK